MFLKVVAEMIECPGVVVCLVGCRDTLWSLEGFMSDFHGFVSEIHCLSVKSSRVPMQESSRLSFLQWR